MPEKSKAAARGRQGNPKVTPLMRLAVGREGLRNSAHKAHGKLFIVYCGVMDALKRIKLTRGISF